MITLTRSMVRMSLIPSAAIWLSIFRWKRPPAFGLRTTLIRQISVKQSAGRVTLETKTGGDKFKFGAARVFPTFHNIIGGKIDSFRPRVTFEGPLIRKRLNFLQSFEYRFLADLRAEPP